MTSVAPTQPLDYAIVDLLVGQVHSVVLTHGGRPLHRVGSHHQRLIEFFAPMPPVRLGEFGTHAVPDLLRIDNDSIEIEDDRINVHGSVALQ